MMDKCKNYPQKLSGLLSYLLMFLLPTGLLFCFRIFYAAGYGRMVPDILGIPQIFLNGAAAFSFYFFAMHSRKLQGFALSKSWYVLAAFAYALSSYAILQETGLRTLSVFAIFPLLFLAYEKMLEGDSARNFLLLLTLCLSVDAVTGSTLVLFLLCALFFHFSGSCRQLFSYAVRIICLFIFALCISGIFSIPYLYDFFETVSQNSYPGFQLTYPLANFVSRFFAGSMTSVLFTNARGINLYFGLFFFLLAVLYFFNPAIEGKKRLRQLLFLFLILCAIETSPVQYLVELLSATDFSTVPYLFFLTFWCFLLALESLSQLKNIKKTGLVSGLLCFALLALFAFSGAQHNFHSTALFTNCVLILFYMILIVLLAWQPKWQSVSLLLTCLIVLELLCNLLITTNQNFIPDQFVLQDQYIFKATGEDTETDSQSGVSPYQEEYETFVSDHTSAQLVNIINILLANVELTDEESESYHAYGLLNFFEELNAICHKIGASEDLFTPADIEITFADSDDYQITPQKDNIYNLYQAASAMQYANTIIPIHITAPEGGTLILYHNFSSNLFSFDINQDSLSQDGYLSFVPQSEFSFNFQLSSYYLNEDLLEQIPSLLQGYLEIQYQNTNDFSMLAHYIGLAFTCVGILLFFAFYLNRDRQMLYHRLYQAEDALLDCRIWKKPAAFVSKNKVYLYALSVPILLYLLCMILFSCIPFGSNSFYDQDGMNSTLPIMLDYYYNLKSGNTIFSMNGGYGYCLYNAFPIGALEFPLTLLTPAQLAVFILLIEGLSIGFCSFSVVYYLTHRLSGTKAVKSDFRMLIPAFLYALNTYMLAMHGFVTWYYTFLMFPLLMLAMDYLMYRKKWLMYTILLALCIIINIQLALYICIYLVIVFFTYHFDGLKDFLQKGIRFALCSILAACNGFFSISNTLLATSDSLYQKTDSILPTPGFHTSFWEQWKQFMILSDSTAVNHDNGGINIYMGILISVLVLLYFFSKRITWKDKLKKLIPILILVISFNGQVSSYLWNGLHYQSNVPNRHVFLFLFLCAVIAYDGLRELNRISIKKYTFLTMVAGIFFCLCQFLSDGNSTKAFVCTLVLLLVYEFIYVIYRKQLLTQVHYQQILAAVLFLELSANMIFTVSDYGLSTIAFAGDYAGQAEFNADELNLSEGTVRVSFPGTYQLNTGSMSGAPTGCLFNSYVSAHQSQLNFLYGFASGNNYTTNNYNNTPLGLALSATKYCFVPIYSGVALPDLSCYHYLGIYDQNYIFEVPDTLSLGFYAPDGILDLYDSADYVPYFWNDFVSLYTSDTSRPIYTLQVLEYDDALSAANTYSYSDKDRLSITPGQADAIINEEAGTSSSLVIRDVYLNLNIAPEKSGNIYLYMNEFVPLGNLSEDTSITIAYPNPTLASDDYIYYFTFDEQVFADFMSEASKNQLEDITIDNNHISGTTDYEKDGYTVLSLAYDKNWSAYIDGEEVEILDPYQSFMVIPTPSGKHTLELVYEPYGMKVSLMITGISILGTILLYILTDRYKKRHSQCV
jgi:uncharacterized membrane protein YfhO